MSRNSRRRTSESQEAVALQPTTPKVQNSNNPFGISFVIPTEVVRLPSGGLFYQEGSTLHGKETIEIKQMTATTIPAIAPPSPPPPEILGPKFASSSMI